MSKNHKTTTPSKDKPSDLPPTDKNSPKRTPAVVPDEYVTKSKK